MVDKGRFRCRVSEAADLLAGLLYDYADTYPDEDADRDGDLNTALDEWRAYNEPED